MSRLRLILSESLRSLGANLSTTVAATMTVLIAMFLLGLTVALGTLLLSWSDHVKRQLVVKVYFTSDATQQQMAAVTNKLNANPLVKRVTFVSKQQALKDMERRFKDLTKSLPDNPFPDSDVVQPKRGEDVNAIYQSLIPKPAGVDKVNEGKKITNTILGFAHALEYAFIVAVALLVGASTLLIANTIRLSIFSRRREIEVMKLVGATNWFVRGPFVIEGLLCGLTGSIAAIVLLLVAKVAVLGWLPHGLHSTNDVRALSFTLIALIMVGVGISLGAAGSGLTLRRFLKV
jgi:cell division transport system permease protein